MTNPPNQNQIKDDHFARVLMKGLIQNIPKFTGVRHPTLYDYITAIEHVSSVAELPADGKIKLAKVNLRGAAEVFLENSQELQNCADWDSFKEKLSKRFDTKLTTITLWQELMSAKQRKNENISEYAERLVKMAKRAAAPPRDETADKKAARVDRIYEKVTAQLWKGARQTEVRRKIRECVFQDQKLADIVKAAELTEQVLAEEEEQGEGVATGLINLLTLRSRSHAEKVNYNEPSDQAASESRSPSPQQEPDQRSQPRQWQSRSAMHEENSWYARDPSERELGPQEEWLPHQNYPQDQPNDYYEEQGAQQPWPQHYGY